MKKSNYIKLIEALEEEHKRWLAKIKSDDGRISNMFKLSCEDEDFLASRETLGRLLRKRSLPLPAEMSQWSYTATHWIIDLQDISLLSPTAADVLVSVLLELSRASQLPVIFTQADMEVVAGLKTSPSATNSEDKIFWAIDIEGNEHLLGSVPDRLQIILNLLKEKGKLSASEIAILLGEKTSNKNINKFSVYLQELFQLGLVSREKIPGSARYEAGRGWTYGYSLATSCVVKCLKQLSVRA